MARTADDDTTPVAPEYATWLGDEVKRAKVTPEDAGYERITHWRAFTRGELTLSAARAYAQALRRKKVLMPPPTVQVLDKEDYEWITLGRALREVHEVQWRQLLDTLRLVAGAAQKGLDQLANAEALVAEARRKK
jgi:hypothetical protein